MSPHWLAPFIALAIAAPLFFAIERLLGRRKSGIGRPQWRTDLGYWFLGPLVVRPLRRVAVGLTVVGLAALFGWGSDAEGWFASRSLAQQPVALQFIEILVFGDLLGYGIHRSFHRGRLWSMHAIHHSSRHLDWLASVRVHPLNDLLASLARTVPLVVLGFDPRVLAGAIPFFALYGLLLHADVSWDFGPLRKVVASPAFHRRHHATRADRDGDGVNFGGLLCVWDLLWGTYDLPEDSGQIVCGTDEPVPKGLWAQLRYPFGPSTRQARPAERG